MQVRIWITIDGVESLHGTRHPSDRPYQAGTYISLAAAVGDSY